jgi:hypothetical protein
MPATITGIAEIHDDAPLNASVRDRRRNGPVDWS